MSKSVWVILLVFVVLVKCEDNLPTFRASILEQISSTINMLKTLDSECGASNTTQNVKDVFHTGTRGVVQALELAHAFTDKVLDDNSVWGQFVADAFTSNDLLVDQLNALFITTPYTGQISNALIELEAARIRAQANSLATKTELEAKKAYLTMIKDMGIIIADFNWVSILESEVFEAVGKSPQ